MVVVDDSALVRRLVTTALRAAPDIEVAGVAEDGLAAIEVVDRLKPDVVTLDIEMPRLDGLGALSQIRESHPRLPVIMFSTLTKGMKALSDGSGAGILLSSMRLFPIGYQAERLTEIAKLCQFWYEFAQIAQKF